jgi:hypothetical protein
VKIYVLLADKGTYNPQVGTLNLLNVGWAVTQLRRPIVGPTPEHAPSPPMVTSAQTVVVFIEAELGMCNKALILEIELLTEDGQLVEIQTPMGAQAVRLQQQIMIPSPAGVPTGFPGHATAMMELPQGLPLAPGIYRWQARVNGKVQDEWSAHFYVAPPLQPPTFGSPWVGPAGSAE